MKMKHFTSIIVLLVLFLGPQYLIAQKKNVFESTFEAYGELADLDSQINETTQKMNREAKLTSSSRKSALKKQAIAVMEQMSFDMRSAPKRTYFLLIQPYGTPVPECPPRAIFVPNGLKQNRASVK